MTEKIPSSVKFGSRPRIFLIRSNSSGVRPCFATSSGVTFGSVVGSARVIDNARYRMCHAAQRGVFLNKVEYCNCHSSYNPETFEVNNEFDYAAKVLNRLAGEFDFKNRWAFCEIGRAHV